ncbi:MAG TPA: protease modulator HflC [Porticoccaceae bacterium]|nr:protease modulator HflC [Porticoccaceae bacterium]
MNPRFSGLIIVVALLLILASNSLYVVKETERAIKLRFGELIAEDIAPGLHVKVPLMHQIRKFDARILTLDTPTESFFTVERKRLLVDSYVKWRIVDVGAYYRATGGDESVAHNRLSTRVNGGLRNQFGTRTLHEVVSGKRDELMQDILDDLNSIVQGVLGIEVIDVRVKRIDLPEEVSEQVYRRMTAEREKEARELRARGLEQAEKIRADADRQKVVIKANAYKQAEQVRGEGDALATAVYAGAYEKDPEFFSFTRSLAAYQKAFSNKGDILLVDPDNDFFRYLDNRSGN